MTFRILESVSMDRKLNQNGVFKNNYNKLGYFYENITKNRKASDYIEGEFIEFLQKNPGQDPLDLEYIKSHQNGSGISNYSESFPILVSNSKCLSFPINFKRRKLTWTLDKKSKLLLCENYQLFEVYVTKDIDIKKFYKSGTDI